MNMQIHEYATTHIVAFNVGSCIFWLALHVKEKQSKIIKRGASCHCYVKPIYSLSP